MEDSIDNSIKNDNVNNNESLEQNSVSAENGNESEIRSNGSISCITQKSEELDVIETNTIDSALLDDTLSSIFKRLEDVESAIVKLFEGQSIEVKRKSFWNGGVDHKNAESISDLESRIIDVQKRIEELEKKNPVDIIDYCEDINDTVMEQEEVMKKYATEIDEIKSSIKEINNNIEIVDYKCDSLKTDIKEKSNKDVSLLRNIRSSIDNYSPDLQTQNANEGDYNDGISTSTQKWSWVCDLYNNLLMNQSPEDFPVNFNDIFQANVMVNKIQDGNPEFDGEVMEIIDTEVSPSPDLVGKVASALIPYYYQIWHDKVGIITIKKAAVITYRRE